MSKKKVKKRFSVDKGVVAPNRNFLEVFPKRLLVAS